MTHREALAIVRDQPDDLVEAIAVLIETAAAQGGYFSVYEDEAQGTLNKLAEIVRKD